MTSANQSGNILTELLTGLPSPDSEARDMVTARVGDVLRPAGALARLDSLTVWLAGWQRTGTPRAERPHVIVFAADHGVAVENVSAYPATVTAAMVDAIRSGSATVSALARRIGATVELVDVGVGAPTGNIRYEDAMNSSTFNEAVQAGVAAVERCGTTADGMPKPTDETPTDTTTIQKYEADLLVVGEMGIANSTAAAAVTAAVLGGDADDWVGPGTGVTGAALDRKRRVVEDALERVGRVSPLEALRRLGGYELAAMAGAVLAARHCTLPVVLDGFIATAAAVPLAVAQPGSLDHCIVGHCSAEPGHRRMLEVLQLDPILQLDMRLGEGSGALLAVPIIQMAAAAVVDVATFEEWGLER